MWYFNYSISDKEMIFKGLDNRVTVDIEESKECENIGLEVFKYAFIKNQEQSNIWLFPILLNRNNGILESNCYLDKKTDDENLEAIKLTIKTYKHIPKRLLSLEIIPRIKDDKERFYLDSLVNDIHQRQKLLEYKFLNNINNIKSSNELIILSSGRKTKYYHGCIELSFLELIQELFKTALLGNIYTEWMLNFSSPFHIWLIYEFQNIYLMWLEINKPINKRKHYESTNNIKKDNLELKKFFCKYNIDNQFTMSEGIIYTVGQLIFSENILVKKYFYTYLESIKKQAYIIGKSKEYKSIPEAYRYYIDYKKLQL